MLLPLLAKWRAKWSNNNTDGDKCWNEFVAIITKILGETVPKRKKKGDSKDWQDANNQELEKLRKKNNSAGKALGEAMAGNKECEDLAAIKRDAQKNLNDRCKKLREEHYLQASTEVNIAHVMGKTGEVYKLVRNTWGEPKSSSSELPSKLEDIAGVITYVLEEMRLLWFNHFKDLFSAEGKETDLQILLDDKILPQHSSSILSLQESFTLKELDSALASTKNKKALGEDGLAAECLKALNNNNRLALLMMFNKSWSEQGSPKQWNDIVLMPVHKKGSKSKTNNYRGISLICHAGKILERMINGRLQKLVKENESLIQDSQFGFARGKSCTDAIHVCAQISEKVINQGEEVQFSMIDLSKAFDSVNRTILWELLKRIGIPPKLIRSIQNLQEGAKAKVKLNNGQFSESFPIEIGCKQGSCISPMLFNLYFAMVMKAAKRKFEDEHLGVEIEYNDDFTLCGFKAKMEIRKMFISSVEYADDCALISKTVEEQQRQINILDDICVKTGLLISHEKTKIMTIKNAKDAPTVRPNRSERSANRGGAAPPIVETVNTDIWLHNKKLERVDRFPYLGRILTCDGSLDAEISSRLAKMRSGFFKYDQQVFQDKNVNLKTKVTIFNGVVVANALYACECWNISDKQLKRTEKQYVQASP